MLRRQRKWIKQGQNAWVLGALTLRPMLENAGRMRLPIGRDLERPLVVPAY